MWFVGFLGSFGSKRFGRVETRGATSGQPGSQKGNESDQRRDQNESRRIPGADGVKKTPHHPSAGQRAEQSDSKADGNQSHRLADDEPENRRALRTQGHANADLAGAWRNRGSD